MDNFYEHVLRAIVSRGPFPIRTNSSIGLYAGRLAQDGLQALAQIPQPSS